MLGAQFYADQTWCMTLDGFETFTWLKWIKRGLLGRTHLMGRYYPGAQRQSGSGDEPGAGGKPSLRC